MSKDLKKKFKFDTESIEEPRLLTTACLLPSGAIETAENRDMLYSKIDYILTAYDEEFRLKANPAVRIVGYLLV